MLAFRIADPVSDALPLSVAPTAVLSSVFALRLAKR